MFNGKNSLISRIIPHQMFTQLCQLWEKTTETLENDYIFLTENDLLSLDNPNLNYPQIKSFSLILTQDLQALLLVENQVNDLYYHISITLDCQAITYFCQQIKLRLNLLLKEKLNQFLNTEKVYTETEEDFLVKLLEILTQPLAYFNNQIAQLKTSQPIESILRNRLEQERILQQVTQQIQQNLDLLVIVKMTIEQVQHLLQLDRLVIYQLDINSPSENRQETTLIDQVTYEAKASEIIPSILNFREDDCFSKVIKCRQKYTEGFNLVVNDIANSDLHPCLKKLMEKLGVKSQVVIPILVNDKVWGLLIAHQCFSLRNWKNNEVNFLKHISEYLAVAIYQSNSYKQLQEQKNILEQEVQTRAKQLQDALMAAQIAHQSKTEFIGNISHELRTPLTCVIGLSGTLLHWFGEQRELSKEQQQKYLKIIQDSGKKLLELINNILDFADIESGKSLLKIEQISLEDLSKQIIALTLEIARNKGVKLSLDFRVKRENNLFFADPERLIQIVFNLIDNGIKFTASGGEVILKIWTENNQAVFQVKDTGIGIYKDQFSLLFTKFQRLETYRNRAHNGTGLGLALTKHLVELHGGLIKVESKVGEGSIFTVYIPNSLQAKLIEKGEETKVNYSVNKTIMLISKDEELSTCICELLTAAEYQVIWLIDSIDAIHKIKVLEPKLLIIEEELGNIYRLSHQIKSWNKDQQVKIVIIKSNINGEEWQELSINGIDEYLLKPLQPALLLDKVTTIVNS
jgi:two-component system sensor histidine kinase/response regulator